MAQIFNSAVLTGNGAALLAAAQAGTATIEITRMAVGAGEYASSSEKTTAVLQPMTSLKDERNSYAISSAYPYNSTTLKVIALITNCDEDTSEALVTEGYYINEICIYARNSADDDAEEVMYSIAVTSEDEGDYMPAYDGGLSTLVEIVQSFYITVTNSTEVTLAAGTATYLRAEHEAFKNELLEWMAEFTVDEDEETLYIPGTATFSESYTITEEDTE